MKTQRVAAMIPDDKAEGLEPGVKVVAIFFDTAIGGPLVVVSNEPHSEGYRWITAETVDE